MEKEELKFSEKTKFSVICNLLEKIEKQKNRDQKVEIMKQFIASFREQSKNHQVSRYSRVFCENLSLRLQVNSFLGR